MGLVDDKTQGFSFRTSDTDEERWKNIGKDSGITTYRQIDAPDEEVDRLAKKVKKGTIYRKVPQWFPNGTNSNTGAGWVAKEANGGLPKVNNGRWQPGSSVTDRLDPMSGGW